MTGLMIKSQSQKAKDRDSYIAHLTGARPDQTRFTIMIKSQSQKAKARDSYIAHLTGTKPDQTRFTIIEVAVDRQEPMVHS